MHCHLHYPERHKRSKRKMCSLLSLAAFVGAFDHLEWTHDGAFDQLFGLGRGEFEQKFSKNSNARGVAGGGMLKLRFDWYIIIVSSIRRKYNRSL